jgi:ribonuclease HI
VDPNGQRETNTITRAELGAILAALQHASTLASACCQSIALFTDSLASLFLIQRVLRAPTSLLESKHLLLLQAIRSTVLARTRAGLHTLFCKVKAHTGVKYNELADATAAEAGQDPSACNVTLSDRHSQYWSSLPAWPSISPDAEPVTIADPFSQEVTEPQHKQPALPYFLNNLSGAVKTHLFTHATHVCGGRAPEGYYTKLRSHITTISEVEPGNFMWDTRRVPFHAIRQMLAVRFGTLWTAAKAYSWNCTYNTKIGSVVDGVCPICHSASDTAAHWLASCSDGAFHACYIARHNQVVCMVQKAVMYGALGNTYTIMDATAANALPPDVAATRVPAWMLPHLPATERA